MRTFDYNNATSASRCLNLLIYMYKDGAIAETELINAFFFLICETNYNNNSWRLHLWHFGGCDEPNVTQ